MEDRYNPDFPTLSLHHFSEARFSMEHELNRAAGVVLDGIRQFYTEPQQKENARISKIKKKGYRKSAHFGQVAIFFSVNRRNKNYPDAMNYELRYRDYARDDDGQRKYNAKHSKARLLVLRGRSYEIRKGSYSSESRGFFAVKALSRHMKSWELELHEHLVNNVGVHLLYYYRLRKHYQNICADERSLIETEIRNRFLITIPAARRKTIDDLLQFRGELLDKAGLSPTYEGNTYG
ncbi:hypothetical protein ACPV5O_20770 [Vibrio maritimus]|jgi:hypothetical protein|uniref:hypothetical protein n=1 Tax=Vibrio maritimus TaxID=990268 RepID=UPI00406948D6